MKKKIAILLVVVLCVSIVATALAECSHWLSTNRNYRNYWKYYNAAQHRYYAAYDHECLLCGKKLTTTTTALDKYGDHNYKSYHEVLSPTLTYYYDRCDTCGDKKNAHYVHNP